MQRLATTLKHGDIVILDNLGSHRGRHARDAIRDCGAQLFKGRLTGTPLR